MCLGNNGLLNKNYWDDFDNIDQGHSKGNVLQRCLFLCYSWTNLTKFRPQWWQHVQQQIILSSDLKNVGQGHHLQKSLKFSNYTTDICQTFIEMIAMWPATKMSSADVENVGQDHISQKVISQLLSNRFQLTVLQEWWRRYAAIGIVAFICRPSFVYPRLPPVQGCTPQTSRLFATPLWFLSVYSWYLLFAYR